MSTELHGIPFAVSFRNIRPFCPDEVVDIPGRRASSLNSCEFRDRENVGPCPRCLPGPVTSPLPAVQRHQLPAVPANSRGIGGGNTGISDSSSASASSLPGGGVIGYSIHLPSESSVMMPSSRWSLIRVA